MTQKKAGTVKLPGTDAQVSVSPREAAQMMGTRLDVVYSLIWAKRLQAEKQDGRWLVSRAAVDARVNQTRRRLSGKNRMDVQGRTRRITMRDGLKSAGSRIRDTEKADYLPSKATSKGDLP